MITILEKNSLSIYMNVRVPIYIITVNIYLCRFLIFNLFVLINEINIQGKGGRTSLIRYNNLKNVFTVKKINK